MAHEFSAPAGRYGRLLCVWLIAVGATLLQSPVFSQSELVIHKDGTKLYHRPGCPEVADRKGILAMTRAQAASRGYKPHEACDPANPDGTPAAGKPEPSPTVYLDGSRYYHRSTCTTLPTSKDQDQDQDNHKDKDKRVKAASLEVAGKSHWPCPTCKPPIRRRSAEPAVPGTDRGGR